MKRVVSIWAVAFVLVALAGGAMAGVYDDVRAWWQFDYGASGVITNPNDIRDARVWYNAGGYQATSVTGTPEWTTAVPSQGPSGGQVFGGRGLAFTPTVTVDGGGIPTHVVADGYYVSDLSLQGDATIMMRFQWDGYAAANLSSTAWMYLNALGGGGTGWIMGLTGGGANPTLYSSAVGSLAAPWTTTPGVWYDLAITMDENGASDTITYYRRAEGGELEGPYTRTGNYLANAVSTSGTRVGFEGASGGAGTNGPKAFKGTMENLAVWNRTLSTDEVRQAFGFPDPMWTLGFNTDNNVNFNVENAAGNNYTLGEPWGKLSRAVVQYSTTNDQVDIHFDASAEQAALGYVFHLDTDGVRSPGLPLTIAVNGQALGTKTVVSNGDYEWYVPASALNAGSNTLSLQYNGPFIDYGAGGTYATWDWLELSGSWQVGLDNGTSTEFRSEHDIANDHFYVTDRVWDAGDSRYEWPNFEQAVSAGDTDTYIHFALSEELTGRSFLLSFEALWAENNETAFDVSLNGVNILASSGALGLYEIPIPWGSYLMQPGDNVIQFHFSDPRGDHRWIVWDWVRLEVQNDQVPEPATLSLLGLGGLALLRRRRRA